MGHRKAQRERQKAEIHDYYGQTLDEYGDPMFGLYWRLMNEDETPLTKLFGPYHDFMECYIACDKAWQQGDY